MIRQLLYFDFAHVNNFSATTISPTAISTATAITTTATATTTARYIIYLLYQRQLQQQQQQQQPGILSIYQSTIREFIFGD